jgi:hypothetical protein
LVEFIDQRFTAIMTLPEAWGSPEAIELQVLLLVELRKVALGHTQEGGVTDVNTTYSRFLESVVGESVFPLAVQLRLTGPPTEADAKNRERFFSLLSTYWDNEKRG